MSSLIEAVVAGDLEEARRALAAGNDPRQRDPDGGAAAVHAIAQDRTDLLGLLLDAGVSAEASEHLHRDPLRRNQLTTALHVAAGYGSVAAVRFLLERGTPVDVRDELEATPLMDAVKESFRTSFYDVGAATSHAEVIALLLARGAELSAQDARGSSVLAHLELVHTHIGVAKLKALLDGGLDVRAPHHARDLIACVSQFVGKYPYELEHATACLDVLLAAGLDPGAVHGALETLVPLFGAAVVGRRGEPAPPAGEIDDALASLVQSDPPKPAEVGKLLKAGPTRAGLDRALFFALVGAGSIYNPSGRHKASKPLAKVIQALTAAGARADTPLAEMQNLTALHLATSLTKPADVVAAIWADLLKASTTIDPLDSVGRSPLRHAVESKRADIVEILLRHGADRNILLFNSENLWQFARGMAPELAAAVDQFAGPPPAEPAKIVPARGVARRKTARPL